eukprot:5712517-Amphidinium_carterae.1
MGPGFPDMKSMMTQQALAEVNFKNWAQRRLACNITKTRRSESTSRPSLRNIKKSRWILVPKPVQVCKRAHQH